MIKEALIIVDVQFDFLEGGALEVAGASDIIIPVLDLSKKFQNIVLTQDWHPTGHKSFASSHNGKLPFQTIDWKGRKEILWPDHCIQNTHGAEIHPKILDLNYSFLVRKGEDLEVDSYSCFFDNHKKNKTQLDQWLTQKEIKKITICGLATDFCVKNSVVDALNLGYEVRVFLKGTKPVNQSPEMLDSLMLELKSKGCTIDI